MDAVEFLTEKRRMCDSFSDCFDCGLRSATSKGCIEPNTREEEEKTVEIVENWSKEHPKKTRQSEFLKEYPNATLSILDNHPSIDPCKLDGTLHNESRCHNLCCSWCREQYWTEEI